MLELTQDAVFNLLPDRNVNAHKGDFGKILLLCGSRGYTGAAALAAMGALRTGAGLVYLGVPESIYAIESVKLTEPIVFPLPDEKGAYHPDAAEEISTLLPKMDAILIGPGMGQSNGALAMLRKVLEEAACPVVIDADGINLLSKHKDMMRGIKVPVILTPHEGEFQRIYGPIVHSREEDAVLLAEQLGCIVVLKGHRTVITDGKKTYLNPTGNPGMAVGGSGDVLAGIVTSLLGQGIAPLEAAACGVWLHGAAGDICKAEIGEYGMLPTDVISALPRLMK